MCQVQVTKRDGTKEKFDVEKIKRVIAWACEGLQVNPLALESKFDEIVYEGISTDNIQLNLIEHAKQMCSPDQPDWTIVAGRLKTMKRWSDTQTYEMGLWNYIQHQKQAAVYKHPAIDIYSQEDINFLEKHMQQERDLQHSLASVVTAESKYLHEGENIQQMFMLNAMIIASVENTPEQRLFWAKKIYDRLSNRQISLATPWLGNLRANGNIASCFILGIEDNLDSIFDNVHNAARISKEGGGVGIYLGALRSKGSWLMGQEGTASGVIGWIKILNDTAVYVNQGGRRAGAFTVALPVWHNDIEDFFELQTEAGDQRKKAYDVQPQIVVPDLFMELKDIEGALWYTFDPYEVMKVTGKEIWNTWGKEFEELYELCVSLADSGKLKVFKKYEAKKLYIQYMRVAFETGLPYVFFVDEVNRQNPNKHEGVIYCGNLCQESYSVFKAGETAHTCSLASIVVGRVGLDDLEEVAADCVRILDNGLALTKAPIQESNNHMHRYRTIGIGVQGFHDIVAREFSNFYNEEFVSEVFEKIAFGATKASILLAKDRGKYPAFEGSDWDNGVKWNHYKNISKNPEKWEELEVLCQQYGIRNSQLTSPAPNTSTSIFMDAAAGVMPVYSAFFYEENKDGLMPVVSMYLKDNPLSYGRSVDRHYPWELAKVVGWMQRWIDTGISAEYIMDKNQPDFKAKWLWDTVDEAWRNKTKAVYYIRSIKKGEKLAQDDDACVACAG